jgi:uncharacterized phosphosugar-binding protein
MAASMLAGKFLSPIAPERKINEQMKSGADQYFQIVREQLAAIQTSERQKIETAAQWVADALANDRFIYAFGSGHSHTLAEELFYRAGGLARIVPILDERLMVHKSATGSSEWERKEGLAAEILSHYELGAGDVFFIVSNSGRNAVPIEIAMEGVRRGAKVVAISSAQYAGVFASRHSSGKKLSDIASLVVDNHGVAGDAVVLIDGVSSRVGPVSTISSAFILNGIMVEATAKAAAAGVKPEVWGSANSDSTNNDAVLKKYKGRVPHL